MSQQIRATVSVFGRFHAFYLANQLQKRGFLEQVITSYPRFEVRKYGIPVEKITSLWYLEALKRSRRMWSALGSHSTRIGLHDLFDHLASRQISKNTNLYVGWSGFSEHGLQRAKYLGAVSILERGSAHILYQDNLLREEGELTGTPINRPSKKSIEKEMREYELADYIEVPSSFALRSFLEQGIPENKLIKGFRGIDLNEFRKLPKEDNVFRVVFAGAMSLQKGVHYLLQAFSELKLPNSALWLIGGMTSEIEPYFRKYCEIFKYLGHFPQAELHKYYSQCSVFVLCSVQDGFGMVLPQAMACGLPLICTTNTGGEDLIENGREGFIVPIRDVDAIKEKILYLYEHKDERDAMGEAARQKVQGGLTWDDYGNQIIETYANLLTQEECIFRSQRTSDKL